MNYDDKTLNCRECGNDFVFTAGEQDFYQQKGLLNQPSRCPQCRANRRGTGGGGNSNHRDRDRDRERPPRQMYSVTCAKCGVETQVPFSPKDDRPVYCSACYDEVRAARE